MEADPDRSEGSQSPTPLIQNGSRGFDSALLLSLVSSLPDALILVSLPQRTISAFNAAAESIFGYSAKELLGRSTRILHVDDASFRRFDRKGRKALLEDGVFRGRFQMRCADGRILHTDHTVCLVDEENGDPRFAVSLVRDMTEQVQREEKLEDQQHMLRRLNRRLRTMQEDERRRLSRDLHDHMGQELTSLDLGLRALESNNPDEKGRKILADCRNTVVRLEAIVNSLALDLRPPMLDDLGLVPAVRWYLGHRLHEADLEKELVVPAPVGPLPDMVQTTAFRVLQESLNNVLRHADASRVEVRIDVVAGELRLQVVDDGVGFEWDDDKPPGAPSGSLWDDDKPPGAPSESLGLLGMTERAETLGGQLVVDTEPGRGTRVILCLPLRPEPGDGDP